MSKIRAIIFDFDGVIVESVDIKGKAFAHLFGLWPQHVPQILDYHMKHGGVSRFEKFDWIYKNLLQKPLSEHEMDSLAEQFSEYVYEQVIKCPFVEGAKEFILKHHKDISLFVVSATPQNEIRSIVRKRGLEKYFVAVFGFPPHKYETYQKILLEYRLNREEVLAVGDAIDDYKGAEKAGLKFIGRITNGKNPFINLRVEALVKNLFALESLIDEKEPVTN
jgi:HAD superfamily hydrolase (TIGR01549 family)